MNSGPDHGERLDDLDIRADGFDTRIDDLERGLRRVRDTLGDTDNLDHELHTLRESVDDAEDTVNTLSSDLRAELRGIKGTLQRLRSRIQALETHAATGPDAPEADLDTYSPEHHELAAAASRRRYARADLLDPAQRSALRQQITAYHNALAQRDGHRTSAVDAAGVLARTPYRSDTHHQARTRFLSAVSQEEAAAQRLPALAARAEEAREALAQDEELSRTAQPDLEAGARAHKKLEGILRTRLADAVRERARLPVWFVTVLGPLPPARGTREWMDLAVDVLTYRLAHSVTDPVVALGPEPRTDAGLSRIAWHQELAGQLERWDR
ncbi:hypothetical protein ACWGJ2_33040 [Streptomyces sp. NPDC054796]